MVTTPAHAQDATSRAFFPRWTVPRWYDYSQDCPSGSGWNMQASARSPCHGRRNQLPFFECPQSRSGDRFREAFQSDSGGLDLLCIFLCHSYFSFPAARPVDFRLRPPSSRVMGPFERIPMFHPLTECFCDCSVFLGNVRRGSDYLRTPQSGGLSFLHPPATLGSQFASRNTVDYRQHDLDHALNEAAIRIVPVLTVFGDARRRYSENLCR